MQRYEGFTFQPIKKKVKRLISDQSSHYAGNKLRFMELVHMRHESRSIFGAQSITV